MVQHLIARDRIGTSATKYGAVAVIMGGVRRTGIGANKLMACGAVVLAVGASACGTADPTSEVPPGRVVIAGPNMAPPSTPTPASTATPRTDPPPQSSVIEPVEPAATDAPPSTEPESTEPDPTEPDPTEPDSTEPELSVEEIDEAGLVTAEPSFEVEPLQPFEIVVAESAEPVVSAVDDAGAAQPTGWAAFDLYLDDALVRNGNTAASVAVSIGGDVVHASAFGLRAPYVSEEDAGPEDRFRIASISKPITAITLLQLVELGVVDLDEPVGQLIADQLGIAPSSGAQALTVRRLLNHTSGFGKYDSQFFRKGAQDCNDAARTGMQRGISGGGYRYSNMNFCVAGILIEALTAKSYEAAVYEHVLTPLGISGMRLANTFDPGPDEILHPSTPDRNYMETLAGAGGWIATPTDLVTIMDSLDLSTPGFKPLDAATVALMTTPVGGQPGQRGYGLGLISYGPNRYGHTGTIENTHAMTMNRGDGVTWSITVSGPYPDNTPRLESIINRAFEAAGFIAG